MCKVCNLKEIIETCTTCDKKGGQTLSPSGVCKTTVSVKPVKPGGDIVRQESEVLQGCGRRGRTTGSVRGVCRTKSINPVKPVEEPEVAERKPDLQGYSEGL